MILVIGLIALNFWVSSQVLSPNPRVRIPYSPMFLTQVTDKNVASISSTGASIEGTFKKEVKYPSDGDPGYVYFSTQIPSFASDQQLFALLQKNDVTINAQPIEHRAVVLGQPGVRVRSDAAVSALARVGVPPGRGVGGGAGGLMSFGRSRARRVEAADQQVRSTMSPASTRPRRS